MKRHAGIWSAAVIPPLFFRTRRAAAWPPHSRLIGILLLFLSSALFAQVKFPDPSQVVGAPRATPLSGAALERRTYEVASMLRCPVCQGMSVADSPSTVAQDMKEQVRELLARGYTQDQILSYFEQPYGQFVLLKPKFRGVNVLVWVLPILVLLGGAILVVTTARRLERASTTDNQQPTTEDPYIARVRELVDKE